MGNGSFKCVVDALDDMPCREGSLSALRDPENYVKIVLPKVEYEAEIDKREELYDMFTEEVASRMFVFMTDEFCAYKEHHFPDLSVGSKVLKFCNTKNEAHLDLVVTYCERGRSFASYGQDDCINVVKFNFLWFMDVAHSLYKLSLNKYMHADVKPLNMVVSLNMGKLIDFGFLRSYESLDDFDYFELQRKNQYAYWPLVFANLVSDRVDTPKITTQEKRTEVFESVDKHGLAVSLLFDCYNWPKVPPGWSLFKDIDAPSREYRCLNVKPTPQNTKFDAYYDKPFYPWRTILSNLRAFFKANLGVDTPALDDTYLTSREAMIGAPLALEPVQEEPSQAKASKPRTSWFYSSDSDSDSDLPLSPQESRDVPKHVYNHNHVHGFSDSSLETTPTRRKKPSIPLPFASHMKRKTAESRPHEPTTKQQAL